MIEAALTARTTYDLGQGILSPPGGDLIQIRPWQISTKTYDGARITLCVFQRDLWAPDYRSNGLFFGFAFNKGPSSLVRVPERTRRRRFATGEVMFVTCFVNEESRDSFYGNPFPNKSFLFFPPSSQLRENNRQIEGISYFDGAEFPVFAPFVLHWLTDGPIIFEE